MPSSIDVWASVKIPHTFLLFIYISINDAKKITCLTAVSINNAINELTGLNLSPEDIDTTKIKAYAELANAILNEELNKDDP